MIRKVRNTVIITIIAIRKHWLTTGDKASHRLLGCRKLVNLLSGVALSATPRTRSTLDVLNGVCSGTKSNVTTDGTGNISEPMNLLMHIQFILVVKCTRTYSALKIHCMAVTSVSATTTVNTISTPACSVTFSPLVAAKLATAFPISTFRTGSSHYYFCRRYLIIVFSGFGFVYYCLEIGGASLHTCCSKEAITILLLIGTIKLINRILFFYVSLLLHTL
mmetsp:Transcript_9614/g.9349  ORF Transcript_9614/g.9349 Transcript_9614/m.9349 type:complete len:220 (-) Transcript_9614:213-872(-)